MFSYATGVANQQNNPYLVRKHIRGYLYDGTISGF